MFPLLTGNLTDIFINMIYTTIVLLVAFPVHESAHGLVALWLGDPTAKQQGRISLDITKHLDPMGTICMLLTGFGWAKPVPVDEYNFKDKKADMAITALAGPLSNFLLSFFSIFIWYKLQIWFPALPAWLITLFYMMGEINANLAIFNLIPLPPLDGFSILTFFLSDRSEELIRQYETYIQLGVMFLLFFGVLSQPISFLVNNLINSLTNMVRLLP